MLKCTVLFMLLFTLTVYCQRGRQATDIRGFGDIVEPDPEDNEPIVDEPVRTTIAPQILSNNDGPGKCRCVPYHQCDVERGVSTADNRVNEFGEVNVKYDPKACQDILDICCKEHQIVASVAIPPQKDDRKGCGIRKVGGIDFTVTGNTENESGFGEFPWTVALLKRSDDQPVFICAGSLIHPSVVLTGVHCVKNYTSDQIFIRAGEWDTQTNKERLPHQQIPVNQIIPHEEFNPRNLANDIALLVLSQPVELGEHINTICLPSQNYLSNSRDCFASGWGKDKFGREGKYSVIMKRVSLPMVDFETCQNALRTTRLSKHFILHPSFTCAGGIAGKDVCKGDGGAPLVCPIGPASEYRYVQVGTVAWGIGCNDEVPGVYANVAVFRTWIDNQMRYLNFDPTSYSF